MFLTIILVFILFALIVILDAAKDVLKSRFDGSFFDKHPKLFPKKWWDARISWKNKWVLDEDGNPKLDKYGERIPKKWLFINIPDAFTDGWHFLKFILWTSLIIITAINLPLYGFLFNFVILSGIYLFFWWLFYNVIFLGGKQ